jgi:hypothetical protein
VTAPRAGLIAGIGASAVAVAQEVGGIVLLTADVARAQILYKMGIARCRSSCSPRCSRAA